MIMNTIDEKWESFKRDVIPKDASPIQLREMKLAFYGAIFSFLEMLKKNINNPQLSEDASIALIETWENEIQLYFKEYNELPNS